ncbi:MAG: TolC family protein, partial [Prevotellaceae bacterium]|nr:TolC family protein [Prevotellaceae bacterium]
MRKTLLSTALVLMAVCGVRAQETWTLRQCIDYATAHNVQVQKNRVSVEDGEVSLWKAKGAVFPSLSFSTSQTFGYRPFEETTAIVQNGQVTNTSSKTTYQGSYGLNANVTLWNGGINQKNIEAQRLQNQINE